MGIVIIRLVPWLPEVESRLRPTAETGFAVARHLLRWASSRTGLPTIVVAALALVVAWRVARKTWHIALEVAVAVALLLVASRLGWIRW